jgi:hypothetical protein
MFKVLKLGRFKKGIITTDYPKVPFTPCEPYNGMPPCLPDGRNYCKPRKCHDRPRFVHLLRNLRACVPQWSHQTVKHV